MPKHCRAHTTQTQPARQGGANVKGGDMLTGQYQRWFKIRVALPAPSAHAAWRCCHLVPSTGRALALSPEAYEVVASLNLSKEPRRRLALR